LGPGIGTADSTKELVRTLIEKSPVPVVLDADGINCLAKNPQALAGKKSDVILTPHPGEMARLTGTSTEHIQEDRIAAARDFAETHKVYLLLKGARTIAACPDGKVYVNPTGNPGMASGGMGDVLTGIIAGFTAQGKDAETACRMGVYLHGASADMLAQKRGPFGYIATDVMHNMPETIKAVTDGTFTDIAHECRPML
ncbi:MAG: NAD(P)H-hydrate dehydratase, partial [Desulfosalsimonas sp.]|uniref:NAD(P)H-hydrate dehydratase n=1 Tax=Desulfosalsimonas sp. TaxID=3073848 RepID=UPI003970BE48